MSGSNISSTVPTRHKYYISTPYSSATFWRLSPIKCKVIILFIFNGFI